MKPSYPSKHSRHLEEREQLPSFFGETRLLLLFLVTAGRRRRLLDSALLFCRLHRLRSLGLLLEGKGGRKLERHKNQRVARN